jgi:WD40-like Beta Propeller Repeat
VTGYQDPPGSTKPDLWPEPQRGDIQPMRRTILLALSLVFALIVGGCLHAPMPWSPDGKWLAYTVEVRPIDGMLRSGWLFESPTSPPSVPSQESSRPTGYRLWATRADSGESVLLEDSPLPLTAPGWSPDGRALAFGRVVVDAEGTSKFEVVILDGPGRRRVLSSRPLGILGSDASRLPGQAIAWSPDGRYLAIPQLNPLGLAILRADNGRQVNTINDGFLPSWSPDGARLSFYMRGTGDTLNCIDSPTGQPRLLAEVGQAGQAPAWSRDGLTLVVAARKSVPRGVEPAGDQVEMLRVRVDTGQSETIRALSNDAVLSRNRAIEGVSIAFDLDGENLFFSTVVEGIPHQITWYHPRENVIYKKFSIVDYTAPMGSLSLSPDDRTLAARIGSIDRLSPPALCDLESPDLRSRLIAPDDSSRVEWIATLVRTARGILGALPTASAAPNAPTSSSLERISLLPVVGEFESNSEQTHRLRRIGRLGRPLCDRPPSALPASPEVVALLDEARLFFDYLSENYSAAMNSLEALETSAETSDRRLRLLGIRAQIFLARGDVDRAEQTIRYLENLDRNPPRRIEWAGSEYVVTATEPTTGRGWPSYLAWRALVIRTQLQDDGPDHHINPDAPRVNFGIGPLDHRGNPIFPNDPFIIQNPIDRPGPLNRPGLPVRPRMPARDLPDGMPRL